MILNANRSIRIFFGGQQFFASLHKKNIICFYVDVSFFFKLTLITVHK